MSTPLIWIVIPGLLAGILLLLQRWERSVILIATAASLSLAALAWWLPVKSRFYVGPWTLTIADTWSILGRRFVLAGVDRPSLIVIYLAAAAWFGAAWIGKSGRLFVPLGLAVVALLTAAIAVEPFLYSALLIEIAVLMSIPFLLPADGQVGRGALRYLTYQTMGMPIILFTGWLLSGIEATPGDPDLIVLIAVMVGLGFGLLLGIFPFHTWIPMLAEEANLYAAGFIFLMLPGAVLFFVLRFFDQYTWIQSIQGIQVFTRWVGVFMVVFGGVLAAFQRHLGRMLAFAVLLEVGLSILVLSYGQPAETSLANTAELSNQFFFAMLLPRGLSLVLWALSLAILQSKIGGLDFRQVQGAARSFPLASASLVAANLSLAGLPLLAGFPVRLAILESLSRVSLPAAFLVLFGIGGLMTCAMRSLAVLVMGPQEAGWKVTETPAERLFLLLGAIALLAVGLLPQWFIPFFANLPVVFH